MAQNRKETEGWYQSLILLLKKHIFKYAHLIPRHIWQFSTSLLKYLISATLDK